MFQRVTEFHRRFGLSIAAHPALPEPTIRDLRRSLLQEELLEFTTAHAAGDRVEQADGLADMCYIIAGTAISYGVAPNRPGRFESPYDGFLPREVTQEAALPNLLHECFQHYVWAEQADDLTQIDLALMSMLTSVFGVAWRLNIPLNAVFTEVHRSNMSKLMPDGSVRRREDGKVLKSPHWSPPDIATILGLAPAMGK